MSNQPVYKTKSAKLPNTKPLPKPIEALPKSNAKLSKSTSKSDLH